MKPAQFIVVEGLEGAGKSTVCKMVAVELTNYGLPQNGSPDCGSPEVVLVREPGGTRLGEQLRQLIKHGLPGEPLHTKVELLLLYAARLQLIEQVIKPALARGAWVVSDRYELSSQAYQGGGRALDQALLNQMRDSFLGDFRPNLTLYLDLEPEHGLQRAQQRGGGLDRIERESLQFFQRVRQRYLSEAAVDKSIVTIDASQPLVRICQQVKQILAAQLTR